MKRRITIEQLKELTDEQRQKLHDLWKPQEGDLSVIIHNNSNSFIPSGYKVVFTEDSLRNFKGMPCNYFPLLDIGQMIEILTENCCNEYPTFLIDSTSQFISVKLFQHPYTITEPHDELCDALWEAVKTLL